MDGDAKEVPTGEIVQTPKVEKLFGKSCEIPKIGNNDAIPIGGNIFNNELTTSVVADFDRFEGLFGEMQKRAAGYNIEGLRRWLQTSGIDVNEKLFASLFAFTQAMEAQYPRKPSEQATPREEAYARASNGKVKLSEVFENSNAACAEIAAIAQYYLQRQGVQSSFFNGEVLWEKDHEFAEPHSFILIRDGKRRYIFDPANPTDTTQGKFPSIYIPKANFDEEVRKNEKKYVTATNLISKRDAYYGVGNGTDVSERNIV